MTIFSQNVNAGARDGYESPSFGFNAGANQLYCGHFSGGFIDLFIRFTSVTIPQGTTISNATLNLTRSASGVGTVSWLCDCIAADNQGDITSSGAYTGATHTTANTTGSNASPATLAINFTSALQEVINRAGWVSGNSFVVCVRNNGAAGNYMEFAAFEHASIAEANVSIDYSTGNRRRRTIIGGTAA